MPSITDPSNAGTQLRNGYSGRYRANGAGSFAKSFLAQTALPEPGLATRFTQNNDATKMMLASSGINKCIQGFPGWLRNQ